MNDENLIPLNKRTKSEQREISKKAGIKSGEIRKYQKSLKEYINLLWSNKVELDDKIFELFPNLKHENITRAMIPILKQQQKAESGDLKALEFLRDTSGQKPIEKVDINSKNVNIAEYDVDKRIKKIKKLTEK
jgi:hypothetical protein